MSTNDVAINSSLLLETQTKTNRANSYFKMENEENLDLDLEIQDEESDVQEESTDEAQEDDSQGEDDSNVEARLAKAEAEASKYRRLFEKARKPHPQGKATHSASPQPSVEETVLLAQGVSEELIEELKLRAPKYGGSLIKAQNDSFFIAVKEKFERDQKKAEASLPPSRGSGSVKAQKDFKTKGLTRDEHKDMFLKSSGLV